jgi:hypothetical protein
VFEHSQSDYEILFAIRPAVVPGFSLLTADFLSASIGPPARIWDSCRVGRLRQVKVTLDRVRPMSVPHGHGSSTAFWRVIEVTDGLNSR